MIDSVVQRLREQRQAETKKALLRYCELLSSKSELEPAHERELADLARALNRSPDQVAEDASLFARLADADAILEDIRPHELNTEAHRFAVQRSEAENRYKVETARVQKEYEDTAARCDHGRRVIEHKLKKHKDTLWQRRELRGQIRDAFGVGLDWPDDEANG